MLRPAAVIAFLTFACPAFAQPLIADRVFVVQPAETTATITGSVGLTGENVGGLAVLGEDKNGHPLLQLLGCRFEIHLDQSSSSQGDLSSIFSRKLTSRPNMDPPSAGVGELLNPRSVGIADPVTSIACDASMRYRLFLYRQGSASRTPTVEALIFEFANGYERALAPDVFYSNSEKPSIQSRDAVRAARGFYRVEFQSEQALDKLDESQRQLMSGFLFVVPKILGLPLP